jgi:hypothetical protein
MDQPDTGDTGTEFDVDSAVNEIGAGLGLGIEPDTPEVPETPDTVVASPEVPETPETPTVRAAPKSWPKDMHEHWAKTDPKVQEYWETREKQMLDGLSQYQEHSGFGKTMKEAIAPFEQMIQQHGLDAPKAVQYLLSAHQRLTHGTPESKLAAYQQLGRDLGLGEQQQIDPTVKALQDEVAQLKSGFTTEQQAKVKAESERIAKEVDAFAGDPAHVYFDECADHITRLITAGYSLQEAYDTAVMANPVTRAKEVARIQNEHEKKLRENARLNALPAKKAAGTNVRTRDTTRAPTEPLGTMEDTMKETLAAINARTH